MLHNKWKRRIEEMKLKEKAKKVLILVSLLLLDLQLTCTNTYAGIADSKFFTGTTQLFNDMKTPLVVLSGIIAVVFILYNLIKIKMAEDETDAKVYRKKIKVIVCCAIGAVLASGLLTVILSYYK